MGGADGGRVRIGWVSARLVPGPAPAASLRFVLGAEPALALTLGSWSCLDLVEASRSFNDHRARAMRDCGQSAVAWTFNPRWQFMMFWHLGTGGLSQCIEWQHDRAVAARKTACCDKHFKSLPTIGEGH